MAVAASNTAMNLFLILAGCSHALALCSLVKDVESLHICRSMLNGVSRKTISMHMISHWQLKPVEGVVKHVLRTKLTKRSADIHFSFLFSKHYTAN